MTSTSIIVITILIVIYTFLAMLSFKFINFNILNLQRYKNNQENYLYENNKFLRHKQEKKGTFWDIVLNSGVCDFGRFGIILLMLWNAILVFLLIIFNYTYNNQKNKILGSVNLLFFTIYSILTFIMNWPLFVRSIPYLLLQLFISIWIFFI